MKKRRIGIAALAVLVMAGTGCSAPATEDTAAIQEPVVQTMEISEFESLLAQQPLAVTGTHYVVQDETYKALYPDMLQSILQNHAGADIKNAVVDFSAWDENDLPVNIQGKFDFSDGAYIKEVAYDGINLVNGGAYGEESGFSLAENLGIQRFKAIAVSFETFEGETWDNPYFQDFCTLYEGQKFSDELTVEVELVDNTFVPAAPPENAPAGQAAETAPTPEALADNLAAQPVTVTQVSYVVQDETYKALYPDFLQAILQNNSGQDIKSAVVAFAAWDENDLPVKIQGQFDFSGGSYIKKVDYADINLAAGGTFG